MNKWILLLLLVGAGAAGFWKMDPIGIFQDSGDDRSLLEYVPADTIFYVGGNTNEKMADFMAGYPLLAMSPSQSAAIDAVKDQFVTADTSLGKMINYLIEDFSKNAEGTYGGLTSYLGAAATGESALYAHGAIPVLHMPLADSEKFSNLVTSASNEAELPFTESMIENVKVRRWKLAQRDSQQLDFVIAHTDTYAVVTLINSSDSEQKIRERLALKAVDNSMASSGEVERLKSEYGINDLMFMVVNFENIARGLMEPETSTLGQDILSYFPSEAKEELAKNISAECKKDYLTLIAAAPRMLGGYTDFEIKNDVMHSDFRMLFEVKNPIVTGALKKMQGHIPAHVLRSDDKLFSIGLATDIDALVPALTEIWTAFINAEFTCDQLQQAQDNARSTSPAMVGMATGMVRGLKGAGLSIYDMKWDVNQKMPSDISALLSVAAENPQSILSLLQMAPLSAPINVPADGTPTKIDLPMLPPGVEVFAASFDQNIVVYTGDQGKQAAETVKGESMEPNGLYGLAFNYRKILDTFKNIDLQTMPFDDSSACVSYHEFLYSMDALRIDGSFLASVSDQGLDFSFSGAMDKPEFSKSILNPVGTWKAELLDESCAWIVVGEETMKADGSGSYLEKDENAQCDLFKMNYTWERHGNKIVFEGDGQEQFRDSCDEEWQQDSAVSYTCYLMNVDKDSFQCIFDPATEETVLFRYTRQ